jgi:hypothetical protein
MDMVNVRNPLCHSSLLQLVQCIEVKVVVVLMPYPCIIARPRSQEERSANLDSQQVEAVHLVLNSSHQASLVITDA